MITTLQHTQPLFKDLSLQPKGRYLLTVYEIPSRKYLYVDQVYVYDSHMVAYREGVISPVIVLPTGALWAAVARECLEFPTFAEVSRQGKVDQTELKMLEQELYPRSENGDRWVSSIQDSPSMETPLERKISPGQYL